MPPKEKHFGKSAKRQTVGQAKRGESAKSWDSGLSRRLNDLTEQMDIMVPEMTARIAALEHLLIKKQLCTRDDLVHAREFVRILED